MFVLSIFLLLLATCQGKLEFSDRARNFSVELMYFTAEELSWHTVISPFGVWNLLIGVSMGTTGDSYKQLRRGLFLSKKSNTLASDYNNFVMDVIRPETPGVMLKNENYLFVDSGFALKSEFRRSIVSDFGANVTSLRFASPEGAAANANRIIQKSDASISDVFRSDDFRNSKMILTNVISFKGFWRMPFNESETRVLPFYDENQKEIGKVNMMQQLNKFQVSNVTKISSMVLELPYDDYYTFLAVLPYVDVKLAEVYSCFETVSMREILELLEVDNEIYAERSVMVNLPRFKISTNVILNRPLQSMGVVDIFDPKAASFRLVSDTEDLYVSAIFHKADIEVAETGTIASSAAASRLAELVEPENFNANRPFLYFVVEKSTATVIFSGAYSKPTIY